MVTLGCLMAEIGEDGLLRRGVNNWDPDALRQQLGLPDEAPAATPA
jgi:hypothetical protein